MDGPSAGVPIELLGPCPHVCLFASMAYVPVYVSSRAPLVPHFLHHGCRSPPPLALRLVFRMHVDAQDGEPAYIKEWKAIVVIAKQKKKMRKANNERKDKGAAAGTPAKRKKTAASGARRVASPAESDDAPSGEDDGADG